MTTKTYDEYEQEQLKKAKQQAAEYETARRAQANTAASKVADSYRTAIGNIEKQYADSAQDTADSYRALFDANAVSELVARRHAEEAIANAGLQRSGLNATHHTALSLQRSNADFKTASQKQKAVDAIMRELDTVRADLEAQSVNKQNTIYTQADADVLGNRIAYENAASRNAFSLYKMQKDIEQAQAEREHELAVQRQKSIAANKAAFDSHGSYNAVQSLLSPNAIKLNAKILLHTNNVADADNYLNQAVNRRDITKAQKVQIAQEIGLYDFDRPSLMNVAESAKGIMLDKGKEEVTAYLDSLLDTGLVEPSIVEAVRLLLLT